MLILLKVIKCLVLWSFFLHCSTCQAWGWYFPLASPWLRMDFWLSRHTFILPQAAFIAFFSDVEHKVAVVKFGYWIPLTYNVYSSFEDDKSSIIPSMLPIDDREFKIKRRHITLLNDKNFLPDGGLLGFGLSYQYPIDPKTTQLNKFGTSLKGSDATIKWACDFFFLKVSIKALYESKHQKGVACLLNKIDIINDLAYNRERRT